LSSWPASSVILKALLTPAQNPALLASMVCKSLHPEDGSINFLELK